MRNEVREASTVKRGTQEKSVGKRNKKSLCIHDEFPLSFQSFLEKTESSRRKTKTREEHHHCHDEEVCHVLRGSQPPVKFRRKLGHRRWLRSSLSLRVISDAELSWSLHSEWTVTSNNKTTETTVPLKQPKLLHHEFQSFLDSFNECLVSSTDVRR